MNIITKSSLLIALAATSPWMLRADPAVDQSIEQSAKDSYNFHTVLNDQVRAEAKNGNVTLTGKVQDENQKQLAEDTVNQLPHVEHVDNQITVESTGGAEHSDSWIALKIHGLLLVKAHVSVSDTHVQVKDGVVTLTGTADSLAQKELTEAYVKDVDGVKSVQNDIQVSDRSYRDEQGHPATASTVDDASITAQVKWSLATHGATSAIRTKVQTNNGVVTISGDANSDTEKALVTRITEDVRGVKSVTNDMIVK